MLNSYVCVDLETTGLNPKTDKIIEIGAVKVIEGVVVNTFSTLVNPGRCLEERVISLTGLRDEELSGAPYIEGVLPKFMEFMEDLPLLGHNIQFDFSFLKKAAVNMGMKMECQGIDTLRIARVHLASLEKKTLEFLCDYYQISYRAHRAYGDAHATHLLYQKLAEAFYNPEDSVFQPKILVYQAKKDGPATNSQKERLYRLADRHKLVLNVDIEKLTKSEASRLADVLRSKGYL